MTKEEFRKLRKSANSYLSQKGFLRDCIRRRDGMREMILNMENQLVIIKSAEESLSEQIEKMSRALK